MSVTQNMSAEAAQAVYLGQYGLLAPAVKTVQTSGQYAGKMPTFQCKEKKGDVASPSLFEQQNFHRVKKAFSCAPIACGLSHCRPQGLSLIRLCR